MKTTVNYPMPARYQVKAAGQPGHQWSGWFRRSTVFDRQRQTIFVSNALDQQGLHGLLVRIRDLGLPLISLKRLGYINSNLPEKRCGDK